MSVLLTSLQRRALTRLPSACEQEEDEREQDEEEEGAEPRVRAWFTLQEEIRGEGTGSQDGSRHKVQTPAGPRTDKRLSGLSKERHPVQVRPRAIGRPFNSPFEEYLSVLHSRCLWRSDRQRARAAVHTLARARRLSCCPGNRQPRGSRVLLISSHVAKSSENMLCVSARRVCSARTVFVLLLHRCLSGSWSLGETNTPQLCSALTLLRLLYVHVINNVQMVNEWVIRNGINKNY